MVLRYIYVVIPYVSRSLWPNFAKGSRGKILTKIRDTCFQKIHRLKKDSDLQQHSKKSYTHFIEYCKQKSILTILMEGTLCMIINFIYLCILFLFLLISTGPRPFLIHRQKYKLQSESNKINQKNISISSIQ